MNGSTTDTTIAVVGMNAQTKEMVSLAGGDEAGNLETNPTAREHGVRHVMQARDLPRNLQTTGTCCRVDHNVQTIIQRTGTGNVL